MKNLIKNIFLLGALACTMYVHAQGDKLKVKEVRSKTLQLRGGVLYNLSSNKGGELILLTKKNNRFGAYAEGRPTYLTKLDGDLKKVSEKQLPQIFSNKRPNYVDLQKIGTKFFLFFTFNNKKAIKEYLFCVQIDPSDLSWFGKPYKVAEIPVKKGRNVMSGYYDIKLSENGKFIVITGMNPSTVKGAKYNIFGATLSEGKPSTRSFSFWLLNQDMKVVNYREDYTIKSSGNANLIMKDFRSDSEGNVIIVAKNAKSKTLTRSQMKDAKKKSSTKIEEMSYKIIFLNNKGEDLEYDTDKDLLLADLKIGFAPDKKHIDAVGLKFEDVAGVDVATGVHTIRLSKSDLSEVINETTAFNKSLIKKMNENYIKNNKRIVEKRKSKKVKDAAKDRLKVYEHGIPNLNIVVDVVYNESGNISVLLEQSWLEIVTVTTTDQNGRTTTTTYYIYHYGDLVMISGLGNESEEPAMAFIDKDDYSQIEYNQGVKLITKEGNWYVMAQSKIYKIDSETLKYSEFAVVARSKASGGSKMRKANMSYSNSIFNQTFVIDNKEFIGLQHQGKKKEVFAKFTPN